MDPKQYIENTSKELLRCATTLSKDVNRNATISHHLYPFLSYPTHHQVDDVIASFATYDNLQTTLHDDALLFNRLMDETVYREDFVNELQHYADNDVIQRLEQKLQKAIYTLTYVQENLHTPLVIPPDPTAPSSAAATAGGLPSSSSSTTVDGATNKTDHASSDNPHSASTSSSPEPSDASSSKGPHKELKMPFLPLFMPLARNVLSIEGISANTALEYTLRRLHLRRMLGKNAEDKDSQSKHPYSETSTDRVPKGDTEGKSIHDEMNFDSLLSGRNENSEFFQRAISRHQKDKIIAENRAKGLSGYVNPETQKLITGPAFFVADDADKDAQNAPRGHSSSWIDPVKFPRTHRMMSLLEVAAKMHDHYNSQTIDYLNKEIQAMKDCALGLKKIGKTVQDRAKMRKQLQQIEKRCLALENSLKVSPSEALFALESMSGDIDAWKSEAMKILKRLTIENALRYDREALLRALRSARGLDSHVLLQRIERLSVKGGEIQDRVDKWFEHALMCVHMINTAIDQSEEGLYDQLSRLMSRIEDLSTYVEEYKLKVHQYKTYRQNGLHASIDEYIRYIRHARESVLVYKYRTNERKKLPYYLITPMIAQMKGVRPDDFVMYETLRRTGSIAGNEDDTHKISHRLQHTPVTATIEAEKSLNFNMPIPHITSSGNFDFSQEHEYSRFHYADTPTDSFGINEFSLDQSNWLDASTSNFSNARDLVAPEEIAYLSLLAESYMLSEKENIARQMAKVREIKSKSLQRSGKFKSGKASGNKEVETNQPSSASEMKFTATQQFEDVYSHVSDFDLLE